MYNSKISLYRSKVVGDYYQTHMDPKMILQSPLSRALSLMHSLDFLHFYSPLKNSNLKSLGKKNNIISVTPVCNL